MSTAFFIERTFYKTTIEIILYVELNVGLKSKKRAKAHVADM